MTFWFTGVTALCGLLWVVFPATMETWAIVFVVLLLVPGVVMELRRWRQ